MLPEFKKYLDNFYLSISGFWCLSQKDVRERLLKGMDLNSLETSINKPEIKVNMYTLSLTLPQAPFKKDEKVNKIVEMQARLLIMGCFDWLKEEFDLNTKNFVSWPETVKIFHSLRNASAHNNKFKFRDYVKNSLPLKWDNKILTEKDGEKELFSRWMSFGDIEYFLEDVSKTDLSIFIKD